MLTIITGGVKGGIGKSTLLICLAEWLSWKGLKVGVRDLDSHQTTQDYLDECRRKGRIVGDLKNHEVLLIDTPGKEGGSTIHEKEANFILVPVPPSGVNLKSILKRWFFPSENSIQKKVIFIPYMLDPIGFTTERKRGMEQLEQIAEYSGAFFVAGITRRDAVFESITQNGLSQNLFLISPENFFEEIGSSSKAHKSFLKARSELDSVFDSIFKIIMN